MWLVDFEVKEIWRGNGILGDDFGGILVLCELAKRFLGVF